MPIFVSSSVYVLHFNPSLMHSQSSSLDQQTKFLKEIEVFRKVQVARPSSICLDCGLFAVSSFYGQATAATATFIS